MYPWSKPTDRPREASSVVVDVSEAGFDEFALQMEDAVAFLTSEDQQVRRLCSWPGVETATLAFGIARREVAAQTDHLPTEFVRLAGALGLAIEVSHYAVSDVDEGGVDDGTHSGG